MEQAIQQIKIEKGIPAPAVNSHRKYPIREMKIGDSFFVPKSTSATTSSVHNIAKKYGFKVITRKEADGVRVWRIA